MSRYVINNEKYTMAFGVDHTPMGAFFQLYENAAAGEDPDADETEQPQIDCDEMYGLRIHNQKTLDRNPKLASAIKVFVDHARNAVRTEEHVINLGKACGLDIEQAVFKLWD